MAVTDKQGKAFEQGQPVRIVGKVIETSPEPAPGRVKVHLSVDAEGQGHSTVVWVNAKAAEVTGDPPKPASA